MSKQHNQDDPIRRLMEWQDHRYDPGYFLGGRIHPILLAPRPNKFGYLLIISGSVYLLLFVTGSLDLVSMFENLDAAVGLPIVLIMWGWGALQVAAGFKLLQHPPRDESQPEYDEVPEELWLEAGQTEAPGSAHIHSP